MPTIRLPANGWRPRQYQRPLWDYLENGGRHGVAVWHRRSGKDEVALHNACSKAHQRIGNYWHMLPEAAHARKAIWDAINPHTGRKRIDDAFPLILRKSTNQTEMKIELKCGSIWQVVGSDNFNSLIGSPPIGITYSEWAVANPQAHAYLRPILAENGGWSLFIYTSRGYNHGFSTYDAAKDDPKSFAQILTVDDTNAISQEIIDGERRAYHKEYGEHDGDALFRQEYYCDWSASNIGAILGRYVEDAERDGRIGEFPYDPNGAEIEISSDLGRRHISAYWFWQPRIDGYALVDYDEDAGLDADEWCDRLTVKLAGKKLKRIWLPHDARMKTFSAKQSALETFLHRFGADKVAISPLAKKGDSINAGRVAMKSCRFDRKACAKGLNALRSWSFKYDHERKQYSKEPIDDWACDASDAYCEGAKMIVRHVPEVKAEDKPLRGLSEIPYEELWPLRSSSKQERRI